MSQQDYKKLSDKISQQSGKIFPILMLACAYLFFVTSAFNYTNLTWFPWLVSSRIGLGVIGFSFVTYIVFAKTVPQQIETWYLTLCLLVQSSHGVLEDAESIEFYQFTGIVYLVTTLSYKGSFSRWMRTFFPILTACIFFPLLLKQSAMNYSAPQFVDIFSFPLASYLLGFVMARLSATKYDALLQNISLKERLLEEQENRFISLDKLSAQVAHDIRSPLAALDMVVKQTSELPEENRLLVRRAVQRIRDIANELSRKKQADSCVLSGTTAEGRDDQIVQLLSGLVDIIVSEKRLQYRDQISVQIESDLGESAYGLFGFIQPVEFKRVLSNLINNAVEALNGNGCVVVRLSGGENVTLSVTDNGKGIPADILPKLMQRGETHGKSGGSGLGLYHARTSVEKWGGKMKIDSAPGRGTTTTLTLPKSQSPAWFVAELVVQEHGAVVIIDDDDSIHQIWKQRFDKYRVQHHLTLFHFSSPEEFLSWQHEHPARKKRLYLCDYEFLNHKKTGLDIIEEMKIAQLSVLVTSRFEEPDVSEGCQRIGVRLIPKNLAGFVPMSISSSASDQSQEQKKTDRPDHTHVNTNPKVSFAHDVKNHSAPDAILIDDDDLVHINWKMTAKRKNKILRTYTCPEPFWKEASLLPKNTPIYVDSNLAEGMKGEDVAWLMGKKGFNNLYLATGTNPDEFSNMPWLKGIIGKDPPWD